MLPVQQEGLFLDVGTLESTADGFVSENALAGAIPTEIGQLTQLLILSLSYNQLTGASKNSLHCNFGIRSYTKQGKMSTK